MLQPLRRTLLAVDDSVGRIVRCCARGLLESTLVIFMGDNGFAFGEHGLIDKRTAYEESMRVPLLCAAEVCRAGDALTKSLRTSISRRRCWSRRSDAAGDGRAQLPAAGEGERTVAEKPLYEYYGSATFRTRRRCTPCEASSTNTSAITASPTRTNCTISAPIRSRPETSCAIPAHCDTAARLNRRTVRHSGGNGCWLDIPLAPDLGTLTEPSPWDRIESRRLSAVHHCPSGARDYQTMTTLQMRSMVLAVLVAASGRAELQH